jgi:ubiquinol-cytochrome c reductase cytochrome b subunit
MPVERRPAAPSLTDRLARELAATGLGRKASAAVADLRSQRVPLHWTNIFGAVAIASLVVLFVTGALLMFLYVPSSQQVTYQGVWAPLVGQSVSKAFASTMHLSLEVRGGLLVRQLHHWAALLLPASLIVQLNVSFFTGAFRRPRRLNWVLTYGLFFAALLGGWSGYALPDDMLAGSGLRIVQGIVLAIPFVGVQLSNLLFGGMFPGAIIEHLYPVHVAVAPALVVFLVWLKLHNDHAVGKAQFRGPGRTNDNIAGVPVWPGAAMRAFALFLLTIGVLLAFASTTTVAPIWNFGPNDPSNASAGSQPDWYTGFLDGALRLVPPGWEFELFGRTWALALLVPLLVTGLFLIVGLVYPFLEEWVVGDGRATDHNLLERPRNNPVRTGLGVAAAVFYVALWGAGSADLIAVHFHTTIEGVVHGFQGLVVLGPFLAFELTRRVAIALQKKDRAALSHGYETGRIVRLPGGEFVEVHADVPAGERWRHYGPEPAVPYLARPDERGRLHAVDRLRAALSRFFFEDRIAPLPAEVEEIGEVEEPALADVGHDPAHRPGLLAR